MDALFSGIVEQGKHLGRRLGFPTANIRLDDPEASLPANGVYAAAIWLDGERAAWPCMLNQGMHPTVPDGKPTIEANLLGYDGDLYGRRVRVEYLHFLRPERRFDDLNALREQLARDRRAVQAWLDASRDASPCDEAGRRAREIEWAGGQNGEMR